MAKQSPLSPPPNRLSTIVWFGVFAIAATFAVVVRFLASCDNFWLDEIWSWMIATQIKSPLEIVTRVQHDNNHYLNTLVLYAFGTDASPLLFRLPAVIAGIGTVLLAAAVAWRWSEMSALTAMVITGCSFLMIQYSSEARGYAYLLFFTIASFAVLQRSFESSRVSWEVLFAVLTMLGFLSHPTYVFAFVAFISWSVWHRVVVEGWLSRRHVVPLVFELLVPTVFFAALYYLDWRQLHIGGGDEGSTWQVFALSVSAAFGGPLEGALTLVVAAAVLVIATGALYQLYRSGSDMWVPMFVGIFVVPATVAVFVQPESPYPRYFLVSTFFLQLLFSWYLGQLYERPAGRIAYLLIIPVILGGNIYRTGGLLKHGRGGYEAAVNFMIEHSSRPQVVVASDHDFRNKTVLEYYFWRAGAMTRLAYVEMSNWPPEGPEWVVIHHSSQNFRPPQSITHASGQRYQLAEVFRYAGLSGFHWAIYRQSFGIAAADGTGVMQSDNGEM